jgi:protein involved in polysaccharide export with SLBB domain
MKWIKSVQGLCLGFAAAFVLCLAMGCETLGGASAVPKGGGGTNQVFTGGGGSTGGTISDKIAVGETITIEMRDLPGELQVFQQTVREDGKITLLLNQTVTAAGLKKGELEQAIHEVYVPKYFRRLTVNVRRDSLFFFVRGEVKAPNRYVYGGPMTVLKAISTAGDFTDFAKRTNIRVTRSDGRVDKVNAKKALVDSSKDLPVYPGDTIFVDRRFW